MPERTSDAQRAIVTVEATPARTYASRQEAAAVDQQNANRSQQMIDRIVANNRDGAGLYESHS